MLRWNTHRDEDRARPARIRTLPDEVKRMQAYQRGRPFCRRQFDVPYGEYCRIGLQGQYLIFYGADNLNVQDLCSGELRTYREEAREHITNVTLTSGLVAYTASAGRCIYWTRLDGSCPTVNVTWLPSANVCCMAGDKHVLVILLPYWTGTTDCLYLLVLDTECNDLKSSRLPAMSESRTDDEYPCNKTWQMLVDVERGVVDLFCLSEPYASRRRHSIDHTRVVLATSATVRSAPCTVRQHSAYVGARLLAPQNVGHKDHWLVRVTSHSGIDWVGVFDINNGEWIDDSLSQSISRHGLSSACWKGSVFCQIDWDSARESAEGLAEDERFFGEMVDRKGKVWGRYVTALLGRLHLMLTTHRYGRTSVESPQLGRSAQEVGVQTPVVNDTFLVALELQDTEDDARIQIFCFDQTVELHGGQTTGLWD